MDFAPHFQRAAGFDFTGHMRALCVDMCARLPVLSHIRMDLVEIRFCQTRRAGEWGMQASLTPLRFKQGERETLRRGRRVRIQPVHDLDGNEMLYLLSFYLPRYLDRPFQEKLETVVHELWHISPAFDGDLRRHEGRCYAHTHSQREYDAIVAKHTRDWLAQNPPEDLYAFLRFNFRELTSRFGSVFGRRIATPKLVAVR